MNRNAGNRDVWFWLTIAIAILLVVAAGSGLFIKGLYRDNPDLVAQAMGQDLVTLLVALPALLIGAFLSSRGSQRGRLIWLGVLVYIVYTYASYAFGIRFNPLFLIYVALLGCSTYALIGGLMTTDWGGIRASFSEGTPVRAVSIFLFIIAVLFYLVWLSEALPASLTGITPESVKEDGTPTNAIHVLDMALLLPALVITAVSLWRKQPMGYALATALLTNLVFLVLAILSMQVFQARGGQPVVIPLAVMFVMVFALSIGMLIAHLKSLKSSQIPT